MSTDAQHPHHPGGDAHCGGRDPFPLAGRTVLVTGQADQSDTIRAVNQAGLDYYIGKPWNPEELQTVVRDQLTEYVLESGVNPLPYVSVLDGVRVMEAIR